MNQLTSNLDWLPLKDYYEYAYHRYFSDKEILFAQWQPDQSWQYPERDILRFQHIIADNIDIIRDHKVLDVACHLGYISLFCLHNGATHVTGTDARSGKLLIARDICQAAGFSNYSFLETNINDVSAMSDLYHQHDTVLLSGIMYHVSNHLEILSTIARSGVQNIIIESLNTCPTIGNIPLVYWIKENANIPENCYVPGRDLSLVGIPNRYWFQLVLQDLGYTIVSNRAFEFTTPSGNLSPRFVIKATRKN